MIEWKVGDDGWEDSGDEWTSPAGVVTALQKPKPSAQRRRRIALTLGIVVALMVAGVAFVQWQSSQTIAAVNAEIQSVLDQEMWALESGNWDLYASLLYVGAPAGWHQVQHGKFIRNAHQGTFSAEVTDLTLIQPDLALAEVNVDPPNGDVSRETRAFRQADQSWRQTTAPAGTPWVNSAEYETAHLRFLVHPADAETLKPLFAKLQELYAHLLEDFELSPLPSRRDLQVVLSVQPANAGFADPSRYYDLSALASTSDAQVIQRELGNQLTEKVLQQFYPPSASDQRTDAGSMTFLLAGIRQWEVSAWMDEAALWTQARRLQAFQTKPFLPLMLVRPQTPPANLDQQTAEALAETVVDYFVWRNGRASIRKLARGAGEHAGWPQLIVHTFNAPYREVDLGWWQFVAQKYLPAGDESAERTLAALDWMLQLEKDAIKHHNQDLFRSLVDPQAPSEWETRQLSLLLRNGNPELLPEAAEIDEWDVEDDVAWISLTLAQAEADLSASWEPLRVYRFDHQRWFLTSADAAFARRPPLISRTKYFEFHYQAPDRGAISAITAPIDPLYEQLLHDFGLSPTTAETNIHVGFVYADNPTAYGTVPNTSISLPSPQIFPPFWEVQNVDPAEFVRGYLGYTVASRLLPPEFNGLSGEQTSHSILYGLVTWEAMQWGDLPFWTEDKRRAIQRALNDNSLPPLTGSVLDRPTSDMTYFVNITLAEYVAEEYGRHRFADVIDAAKDHDDLRDIIPAALGVDFATFEAGWRSYLERTYAGTHS